MRLRPLARRRLNTSRPPRVDIRLRKPWRRERLVWLGWNVRFTDLSLAAVRFQQRRMVAIFRRSVKENRGLSTTPESANRPAGSPPVAAENFPAPQVALF